jgi:hypothetical protein
MGIFITTNSTTYIEKFYINNTFYTTIAVVEYDIIFSFPPNYNNLQSIVSYKEKNNIEEFFSYYN